MIGYRLKSPRRAVDWRFSLARNPPSIKLMTRSSAGLVQYAG